MDANHRHTTLNVNAHSYGAHTAARALTIVTHRVDTSEEAVRFVNDFSAKPQYCPTTMDQ